MRSRAHTHPRSWLALLRAAVPPARAHTFADVVNHRSHACTWYGGRVRSAAAAVASFLSRGGLILRRCGLALVNYRGILRRGGTTECQVDRLAGVEVLNRDDSLCGVLGARGRGRAALDEFGLSRVEIFDRDDPLCYRAAALDEFGLARVEVFDRDDVA